MGQAMLFGLALLFSFFNEKREDGTYEIDIEDVDDNKNNERKA